MGKIYLCLMLNAFCWGTFEKFQELFKELEVVKSDYDRARSIERNGNLTTYENKNLYEFLEQQVVDLAPQIDLEEELLMNSKIYPELYALCCKIYDPIVPKTEVFKRMLWENRQMVYEESKCRGLFCIYKDLLQTKARNLKRRMFDMLPAIRDRINSALAQEAISEDVETLATQMFEVHVFLDPNITMFLDLSDKLPDETIRSLERWYANPINTEVKTIQDLRIYVLEESLENFKRRMPLLCIKFPEAAAEWCEHGCLMQEFSYRAQRAMDVQQRLNQLKGAIQCLNNMNPTTRAKILASLHNGKSLDYCIKKVVAEKNELFPSSRTSGDRRDFEKEKFTDPEITKGVMFVVAHKVECIFANRIPFGDKCWREIDELEEFLSAPEDLEAYRPDSINGIIKNINKIKENINKIIAFVRKMQAIDLPDFKAKADTINNKARMLEGQTHNCENLIKRYGQMSPEKRNCFMTLIAELLYVAREITKEIDKQEYRFKFYKQYLSAYEAEQLKV